jgi:hypothetical protein
MSPKEILSLSNTHTLTRNHLIAPCPPHPRSWHLQARTQRSVSLFQPPCTGSILGFESLEPQRSSCFLNEDLARTHTHTHTHHNIHMHTHTHTRARARENYTHTHTEPLPKHVTPGSGGRRCPAAITYICRLSPALQSMSAPHGGRRNTNEAWSKHLF